MVVVVVELGEVVWGSCLREGPGVEEEGDLGPAALWEACAEGRRCLIHSLMIMKMSYHAGPILMELQNRRVALFVQSARHRRKR